MTKEPAAGAALYIDEAAGLIFEACGLERESMTKSDRRQFRIYAVLMFAKGADTTSEDVHNAWAALAAEEQPLHRSIIPFDALTPERQGMDDEYRDAIHKVARGFSFHPHGLAPVE